MPWATTARRLLPALALLLALAACHHPLAGFYLADVPQGAALFELDTGAGDTIAGRLHLDIADAAGTLVDRDLPISGTTADHRIMLDIGAPSPFAPAPRLVGHRVGNALVLDGMDPAGRPIHLMARACTEAAAEGALLVVKTRAATARAAAERAAADRAVQQTTLAANAYTDAAEPTAARIAQIAALAPALTARMRAAAPTPRDGTLLALAERSAIMDSQLRLSLFQAANTATLLQRRIAGAQGLCRGASSGLLKADCMTLASVTPGFTAALTTVARAYAQGAFAWQHARAEQATILEQARGGK